jgi:hypothetical protein
VYYLGSITPLSNFERLDVGPATVMSNGLVTATRTSQLTIAPLTRKIPILFLPDLEVWLSFPLLFPAA